MIGDVQNLCCLRAPNWHHVAAARVNLSDIVGFDPSVTILWFVIIQFITIKLNFDIVGNFVDEVTAHCAGNNDVRYECSALGHTLNREWSPCVTCSPRLQRQRAIVPLRQPQLRMYARLSSLPLCYDLDYQLIPCCLMHVNNPPFPGCNMKNLPVIYSSHCNMLVGKSAVSLWYKLFMSTMRCITDSTLISILCTLDRSFNNSIEANLRLEYKAQRAVQYTPIHLYLLHKYMFMV